MDYPRSCLPSTYVGGDLLFPLPFPIFDLVHNTAHAAHLLVSVQMNSCIPEQLLPGNWITDEENSCYPNSSLPGSFQCQSIIFYSNPHGRCDWQFCPLNSISNDLPEFVYQFGEFSQQLLCGILHFDYFNFSCPILNPLNIRGKLK